MFSCTAWEWGGSPLHYPWMIAVLLWYKRLQYSMLGQCDKRLLTIVTGRNSARLCHLFSSPSFVVYLTLRASRRGYRRKVLVFFPRVKEQRRQKRRKWRAEWRGRKGSRGVDASTPPPGTLAQVVSWCPGASMGPYRAEPSTSGTDPTLVWILDAFLDGFFRII